MNDQALSDLTVLDLTQGIAGPYCTKLMADFGADVIKVERPGSGDPSRAWGPFPGDVPHPEKSGAFLHLNTNKKSITLNLQSRTGAGLLRKLARSADILVESFEPGVMARLDLPYEVLGQENPRLIMTSVTPFGQTGPYARFKAGNIVLMAMGGLMYVTGDQGQEPLKTGGTVAEYIGGLNAFTSTLIALWHRDSAGLGQHVDVSILEALSANLEYLTVTYSYIGAIRGRSRRGAGGVSDIFPCQDGHITVNPVGEEDMPTLAVLIEQPELGEHPLFKDQWARMERWEEFEALLSPWLMAHGKQEILERAQELRMAFAPVSTTPDLLEDIQNRAREYFVEIDHPDAGRLTYPGAPAKLSATPWKAGRAPRLGEHNEAVYCGRLGYSKEDLVRLRASGCL